MERIFTLPCLTIGILQLTKLTYHLLRCSWDAAQEPNFQPLPCYWNLNILPRGLNKVLPVMQEFRKGTTTNMWKNWSLWVKEILCESENQDRGCRLPAVNKISEAPRPYVVKSQGTSFRRNRRDLIKMANPVSEQLKDSEVIWLFKPSS